MACTLFMLDQPCIKSKMAATGPCHPLDLSFSRGKKDFGFTKFYSACKLKIPNIFAFGKNVYLGEERNLWIWTWVILTMWRFFKKEEMQREVILNLNFSWPNINSHCHWISLVWPVELQFSLPSIERKPNFGLSSLPFAIHIPEHDETGKIQRSCEDSKTVENERWTFLPLTIYFYQNQI